MAKHRNGEGNSLSRSLPQMCIRDSCYVIDRARGSSQSICAWATSDKTGISMKLYTTQPGIQLYTGNFLQDCPAPGKGCLLYTSRGRCGSGRRAAIAGQPERHL